jgi:acetyl-CoA acetyltransferase
MVTGTLMSFDEARALGLVNAVLEGERFRENVLEYAAAFVPPQKASMAVGRIKRAVTSGLEASFSEGLALERELQQQLFLSNDAREGIPRTSKSASRDSREVDPMTKNIVIAGAVRTPIGKFGGALKTLSAADLGVAAARGALERSGVPTNAVGEVIFGNARQAGVRPNVARQISYRAGLGESVPAYTINKACGSSLKAIINAYGAVALGDAEVVLAGGTESMSNTPYLLLDARWGQKLGSSEVVDGMYRDGFLCPLCGQLMGDTAETLADRHRISREESDRYALESQHRCERARKEGRFRAEVVPVEVKGRKGEVDRISTDEHPQRRCDPTAFRSLAPVFRKDGTVHAGNSSGITDGAAPSWS